MRDKRLAEPEEGEIIGYAVDVIDTERPLHDRIVWSTVKSYPMKYQIVFRVIKKGEMLK